MVVDRLRWLLRLLLFAVAIGAVLVYFGWSQATRIREVQANGVEGIATIDSVKRTTRGTSESYSLKLAWRQANGPARTAYVPISNTFAHENIGSDLTIRRGSVRIKYLPASESDPIVLEDADRRREENDLMVWLGGGLAGAGAIGSGLLFLLGRRRREEATAA